MPRNVFNLIKYYVVFSAAPFVLLFPFLFSACFQNTLAPVYQNPIDSLKQEKWVDSVFQTLSPKEKIGQLFSIRAHSNLGADHIQSVIQLIKDYHVGGLTFFQGGPGRQSALSNYYQSLARIPLMIAIDGEWGLGMRLDSTLSFPRQMTLGAIQDDSLIYQMGQEVAAHCKRIGIHVNFAPVVDINNNPGNPVIGDRSFGEDKESVARKGVAYMRGMQDAGILANAKHFPGHGDTDQDSHYTLPIINHDSTRLDSLELYPFQKLIDNGIQSMMVAHLKIPALDNRENRPTTLSQNVVSNLLQNKMHFQGLIFTDALEMQGVAKYFPPGVVSVEALLAGNDVLLVPGEVPKAIEMIELAIQNSSLSWVQIDQKVKKVLRGKYFAGLQAYKPIDMNHLHKDLNSSKAQLLREKLFQKALTLVKNEGNLIPLQDFNDLASVVIGESEKNVFQQMLDNYAEMEHYQIPKIAYPQTYEQVLSKVQSKKTVIVSIHGMNKKKFENYGINNFTRDFIQKLSAKTKVIVIVNGIPYSLKFFELEKNLLCSYEDNPTVQRLTAQLIFGAFGAEGKLPVTVSTKIKLGSGVTTQSLKRLAFNPLPEAAGLNSDTLQTIDQIVEDAIREEAFPGCQVLVARRGIIVWNKAYGTQMYDKKVPVTPKTVYDVASITKVSSTLPAIMYLVDQGKLDLDKKVSDYLEDVKKTDKKDITLREVLTHQAGLIPYIPHWERTLSADKTPDPKFYRKTKSTAFPHAVAEGMYSTQGIEDTLWKWSMESKIAEKPANEDYYPYNYSDISFYILKRIAEQELGEPIEAFIAREFHRPLGMHRTTFLPLEKFPESEIAPTEKDTYFRNQTIRGYVHDQGAALLGGVGGHAGLFSTALDLAHYMQMHLQKGYYGGKRFLKDSTVVLFARKQYPQNRRGLGWDKADADTYSYIPDSTSASAFGHSGFTGCVVWADPDEELLIVFLSNRVHPSAENKKILDGQIRRKIQNVVYQAMQ
ncbi:MAG: glycoside hydrolase family 3 N-terminal domain-containing protein [Microscillaceae bacterium]|nr:glycoside hydrolase family 3 N-terminal domain-containing protein [Microscillaceae bacterium]